MNAILKAVNYQLVLVYSGEFVIYLEYAEELISDQSWILTVLNGASVTLKLKMSRFFTDMIGYFYHVMRS